MNDNDRADISRLEKSTNSLWEFLHIVQKQDIVTKRLILITQIELLMLFVDFAYHLFKK